MSKLSSQELHDLSDQAAYEGDYQTANAYRLLEGNARGGEVIEQWAYTHPLATEEEIRFQVNLLARCWGASEKYLRGRVTKVFIDAGRL